jgi:hypothetical protein
MKIVVTYEASDITRLIKQDLAQQGISASEDDIKFSKNKAVVSVEVTRDDVPSSSPVITSSGVTTLDEYARQESAAAPPALAVVDGGQAPVDMDAILRASAKAAATNPGKFPTPERQLMEGESLDFPGGKR